MQNELLGGTLIGVAAALLWLGIGRISGMTAVISGLFAWRTRPFHWGYFFLAGLLMAWPLFAFFGGHAPIELSDNKWLLISAGLLVGWGTYLANGCTSGHGVCGVGRVSRRSIIATCTFMATGIVTVALMNALGVQP